MIAVTAEPMIAQLAPAGPLTTVDELIAWSASYDSPFATTRRTTLARLSQRILRDPTLRADAASVALAYWLRRANLDRLADLFSQRQSLEPDIVFVPVGRVFHVAPNNVDTVFVYSWALSYLCGNQNVVRVSGQQSQVLGRLLGVLAALMQDDAELAVGNRFVTYPHDESASAALSRWANHRVVWGGNETVMLLRTLPLSPHASERAFASKYSYSIISAESHARADDQTLATLAAGYFNDIFWFDQMACSSPHLIAWIGPPGVTGTAIRRFHTALEQEIERRGYRGSPGSALHRLNYLFDLACDTALQATLEHRECLGIELGDGVAWRKEICGAGLLTHVRANSLGELAAFAGEQDQTITHFGFSAEELRAFARVAGPKGVDRLVPVGEALAFEPNWDGFDLIGDFTRRVTVRL